MIMKVMKLNKRRSVVIGISVEFVRELSITENDYINVEKVGNCLHITKIRIE